MKCQVEAVKRVVGYVKREVEAVKCVVGTV